MELAPGSVFGPFKVVSLLGSGGMASVYKAYDETLERHVALKVVHVMFLSDPTFAERFRREAKVVAALEHPHIVPIHAFGVEKGSPWMAMRLVSGGALSHELARGRLAASDASRIVGEMASALDYAHKRGVVHRDVKPQNMLLDEMGRTYLADFGIARLLDTSDKLTSTGTIQGTPAYMAPEQATGGAVDSRADVYALGVVAYEALTGSVPFSGSTPVSILLKHVSEPLPLPPPSDVPAPVAAVLERCLAKKAEDRFQSAPEFAAALEASLLGTRPAAPGAPKVPEDSALPLKAILAGVVAALALGAAGVGLAWWLVFGPASRNPHTIPLQSSPGITQAGGLAPGPAASGSPAVVLGDRGLPTAGPIRIFCESRPHAEIFGKIKAEDILDSLRDVKRAIARHPDLTLVANREEADVVLQVLERGRTPPLVGMRQVRARLVVGNESVEMAGQDSFASFNTWSGAANGTVDRVETWLRANRDRILKLRESEETASK